MTLDGLSFACWTQEHFLMEEVPLTNAGPVLHLEWSPLDQELCLMATTSGGRVLIWTHAFDHAFASGPFGLKDWELVYTRDLTGMYSVDSDVPLQLDCEHTVPAAHSRSTCSCPCFPSHCQPRPHARCSCPCGTHATYLLGKICANHRERAVACAAFTLALATHKVLLPQLDSQGTATCQGPVPADGRLIVSAWFAVCARWLEQPSPWLWPRAEAAVTAGQAEPDREGILSRFGPHCGPPGRLHWVRPGLLAAALITRQGSLEVCQHLGPCVNCQPRLHVSQSSGLEGGRSQGAAVCKEKKEQSPCDSTFTCSFFGKA